MHSYWNSHKKQLHHIYKPSIDKSSEFTQINISGESPPDPWGVPAFSSWSLCPMLYATLLSLSKRGMKLKSELYTHIMYMYMYVYTYIYVYLHHICIYICIYIYIHMNHTYIYIYVQWIYIYINTWYIYVHTHTYMCTIYTYIHTSIYTTYIWMYIYTYDMITVESNLDSIISRASRWQIDDTIL